MKDFWAAEASNVMGSLGLGGILNLTEAVYQVEVDHCHSPSSQEPHECRSEVTKACIATSDWRDTFSIPNLP